MHMASNCSQVVCALAHLIPIGDAARLVAMHLRLNACIRVQREVKKFLGRPLLPRRGIRGFVLIKRGGLKASYTYDASSRSAMRLRDDLRKFCESLPQEFKYAMLPCVLPVAEGVRRSAPRFVWLQMYPLWSGQQQANASQTKRDSSRIVKVSPKRSW